MIENIIINIVIMTSNHVRSHNNKHRFSMLTPSYAPGIFNELSLHLT